MACSVTLSVCNIVLITHCKDVISVYFCLPYCTDTLSSLHERWSRKCANMGTWLACLANQVGLILSCLPWRFGFFHKLKENLNKHFQCTFSLIEPQPIQHLRTVTDFYKKRMLIVMFVDALVFLCPLTHPQTQTEKLKRYVLAALYPF